MRNHESALQRALEAGDYEAAEVIRGRMAQEQSVQPQGPASQQQQAGGRGNYGNFMGGMNKGIAGVAGFIPDAVGGALNAVLPGDPFQPGYFSKKVEQGLNKIGVGTQYDEGSSLGKTGEFVGAGVAGGLPFRAAMAPQMAQKGIAGLMGMGANEAAYGALAGSGAVLGEAVGGAPGELVGALAAPFLPTAAAGATRSLMRGPGAKAAQRLDENIKSWMATTGAEPTLSQATERPMQQFAERVSAFTPGASTVAIKTGQQQQSVFAKRVGEYADELSRGAAKLDDFDAGNAIIKGVDDAVAAFKGQADQLYKQVDALIPPTAPVAPTRTRAVLEEIIGKFDDAELRVLANEDTAIAKWLDVVSKKAETGIAYSDFTGLRSAVGRKIGSSELLTQAPKSDWKRLYGALSDDIRTVAAKHGAEDAVDAASAFWRQGQDDIKQYLGPLYAKGSEPIRVWDSFKSGAPKAVNQLKTLKARLPAEQWRQLQAKYVSDMGAVPPSESTQDVTFSSQRFLTEWKRMSPPAKEALVDNATVRENINQMARHFETMRKGSQLLYNTSGTAGSGLAGAVLYSTLASIVTGNILPVVTTGLALGAANTFARVMLSKRIAPWLAEVSRMPAEKMPGQIARLSALKITNPEEAEARDVFVEALRAQTGQP